MGFKVENYSLNTANLTYMNFKSSNYAIMKQKQYGWCYLHQNLD